MADPAEDRVTRSWDASVTWVDARASLPGDGLPVAAAVVGDYPVHGADGEATGEREDVWLVLPMYFTRRHFDEGGVEHHDCFVDSDGVVRLPYGRPCDEPVTHWAALPALPGMTTHSVLGPGARDAVRRAVGATAEAGGPGDPYGDRPSVRDDR
ncbi:AQJ64_40280 family protein [Streptomyces sp. NPDC001941]|uniref:AQJ64_40280 family protein n=1 Tax=Streptomyces sp. NPDC001941 TaxID=3154659 RepID=UPI0033190354